MAEWEDISSYSNRDRISNKQPTCWSLKLEHLEIKIHRTWNNSKVWHVSCVQVHLGPIQLWPTEIEEAKELGLMKVAERLLTMSKEVTGVLCNSAQSAKASEPTDVPTAKTPPSA